MDHKQALTWRKGLILSATFLFSILIATTSCKKKETTLGQNVINNNDLLNSWGVDTFSLETYTFEEDSVISDDPAFGILGNQNDPEFGTVNSEIYTQFQLEQNSPNFGDLAQIQVDSFVLGLEYVGFYGKNDVDLFVEVFEINDANAFADDDYYTFSTHMTTGVDLVETGKNTIRFNTSDITVIGNDTVDAQVRIPLDTNKAWQIINDTQNSPGSFTDDEAFKTYFKGLHIRTVGTPMPGEGGVFYFNMNDPLSKLTMYYKIDGVPHTFDFTINSDERDFNHVDVTNTGTDVQTVLDTPAQGMDQYYAQAFKNRAVVKIPGLSNIPNNAVVHKAVLELPIQYQTGALYPPGSDVSVATWAKAGDNALVNVGVVGSFSSTAKHFEIDVRNYVQNIINGEIENTGLVFSPILFITSADRIIFNGPQTTNKEKPKLRILYTEF